MFQSSIKHALFKNSIKIMLFAETKLIARGNTSNISGVCVLFVLLFGLVFPLALFILLIVAKSDPAYVLTSELLNHYDAGVTVIYARNVVVFFSYIIVGLAMAQTLLWGPFGVLLLGVGSIIILEEIKTTGDTMRVGFFGLALKEYRRLLVAHQIIHKASCHATLVAISGIQMVMPVIITCTIMGTENISVVTLAGALFFVVFTVPFISDCCVQANSI